MNKDMLRRIHCSFAIALLGSALLILTFRPNSYHTVLRFFRSSELACTNINDGSNYADRYRLLKAKRTMIIADLWNSQQVLPTWMAAIEGVAKFIGESNVYLSILESHSSDRTPQMLDEWAKELKHKGLAQVTIVTKANSPNFKSHNRIEVLAQVRNQAMNPLMDLRPPPDYIIFLNDVYVCPLSILELAHQHLTQKADMTCAMDWWTPDVFYDIWVARDLKGNLFYPVNGAWREDSNLFKENPDARTKYLNGESFQVYSCWNGMVVLNSAPFISEGVRFRRSETNECAASEAQLLAKDLWKKGHGKIMVVPTVNVAYKLEVAEKVQRKVIDGQKWNGTVTWTYEPPVKVRCHPWPEENGLDKNVWSETRWVDPV